jgi:hypothetical protein
LAWLAGSSFGSFAFVFLLFSRFMAISHPFAIDWLTTLKTALFALGFLPPFYFIGKTLTALFYWNRERIGKLYAADLFGASLAAFATPMMFHFLDLPYLIFTCLLGMTAVFLLFLPRRRLQFFAAFCAIDLAMLGALVFLEGAYDLSAAVSATPAQTVKEIMHRWNEFSRVSLLRIRDEAARETSFRIIHDNAESNVFVDPYDPENPDAARRFDKRISLPFLFQRDVNDVLVMFAGAGRQMLQFYAESGGRARVTGVEINPLCREFAERARALRRFRLAEFYSQPNVNLVTEEGRCFLENDRTKYDVVYVASDAATSQIKTGHSRKYLDTVEALRAYLDHLCDGGLAMFHCMPSGHRLLALHAVAKERGWGRLDDKIILLSPRLESCDYLVVSPSGFSPTETGLIRELWAADIQHLPGYTRNNPRVMSLLLGQETDALRLVTDDSPFIQRIDVDHYRLFPQLGFLKNMNYYKSWIKITTLVLIAVVIAGIVGGLYWKRAPMPPAGLMLYLAITGVCYMFCEIAYIARLELFMGAPLYSMALLLTIFLMTNAAGSWLYNRLQDRLPMTWIPLVVAGIVLATAEAFKPMTANWLGLPLALKILLVILVTAPTGLCLGLFYPSVIAALARGGRESAVPVTYAVSTLSSVAGASYAMTAIVNFGFTSLIRQAAIGYAALTVLMVAGGLAARRLAR